MNENDMQHGREWSGQPIVGFLASEKLHGCRAYWDGFEMWSRGGQQIHLPTRIRAGLPTGIALDGEIFAGRASDGWALACEAVNFDRWDARCTFKVFDAPEAPGGWAARMQAAAAAIGIHAYVTCVPSVRIVSTHHAITLMDHVQNMHGEGIMLRDPVAPYQAGRHKTVLKMKRVPHYLRQSSRRSQPLPTHAIAA